MDKPLNPHEVTLRGIKLPRFLAVLKYWFDEFRNTLLDFRIVVRGIKRFRKEKVNCLFELDHLQKLAFRTRGVSGYAFHWFLTRKFRTPFNLEVKGVIQKELEEKPSFLKTLHKDGYYLFSERAPEKIIDGLREVAFTTRCFPRCVKGHAGSSAEEAKREQLSPVYDYQTADFVHRPVVQQMMMDTSVIETAQRYLGCQPILDSVAMWWTFPSKDPFIEGAQAYHFDMDRFRWIKFFFYLDNVDENNGPHCFIRGSHRPFNIPWDILKFHYERHSDEYVGKFYPKEDFKVFTGPKGTILVEDTRGLHKGKPAVSGSRLMFELEFTGELFGALLKPVPLPVNPKTPFGAFVQKHRRLFDRFEIVETKD